MLPVGSGEIVEIALNVRSELFQVVGVVKALKQNSEKCIEFEQLGDRAKEMLADVITEMAHLQAAINKFQSTNPDVDVETLEQQVKEGNLTEEEPEPRIPIFVSILKALRIEPKPSPLAEEIACVKDEDLVVRVDFVG
jgi:hypothetical protein